MADELVTAINCASVVEKSIKKAIAAPKVPSSVVSRLGFEFAPADWTKLLQLVNRSIIQKQSGHWTSTVIYEEIEQAVFCFTFCAQHGGEIEAAHVSPFEECLAMFCDNFVSVIVSEPELHTAMAARPSVADGELAQWEEAMAAVGLHSEALLVRMLPYYLEICGDELGGLTRKYDAVATSALLMGAVHAVVHECLVALTDGHITKTKGLRQEFDIEVEDMLIEAAVPSY